MVIVPLTTVVIYAEQNLNKDILDLRINITIIMQDIENNCSKLLQKHPSLINLPDILPTYWRAQDEQSDNRILAEDYRILSDPMGIRRKLAESLLMKYDGFLINNYLNKCNINSFKSIQHAGLYICSAHHSTFGTFTRTIRLQLKGGLAMIQEGTIHFVYVGQPIQH
ncbi:unnamed protein product [Rotaria magnacalcarata]|uniref:Uncharacterized protein n=2 Tax=Rotaria magnacalcarata TaxID=392030 RepID=A0A815U867_9BILA|nr:unnamed protein product [Rotaria magnacalcarata]